MRNKAARQRIEVNLEELDRIIDHGTRAPISESDGQKIKAALHAMADRLTPKRSTEKTSAVLPKPAPRSFVPADGEGCSPGGHGRNGCRGACGRNQSYDSTCHAQVRKCLPGMRRGKSLPAKGPGHVNTHCGASAAEDHDLRDGATPLQRLRGSFHR